MKFDTPYIIAEIGSNWCQFDTEKENLHCAKTQIRMAEESGASAVKFQFFRAAELYGSNCYDSNFSADTDRCALPQEWLSILEEYCSNNGIDFLCSAFSVKGILRVAPFVDMHKLASPEFLHPGMREALLCQEKPVIYSLGCADQYQHCFKRQDIILSCVSDYPADPTHYDLIRVKALAAENDCKWGISDHTEYTWLARYARSLGATVFEKHVDFVEKADTPDSCVSCGRGTFKEYVDILREQEVVDHEELTKKPLELYGRIAKGGDYYRPFPPKVSHD